MVEQERYAFYVEIMYEKLLEYCAHCKFIGYSINSCHKLIYKNNVEVNQVIKRVDAKPQIITKYIEKRRNSNSSSHHIIKEATPIIKDDTYIIKENTHIIKGVTPIIIPRLLSKKTCILSRKHIYYQGSHTYYKLGNTYYQEKHTYFSGGEYITTG